MSIKDAVKVDSKTFFTYELKDAMGDGTGYYRDPFIEQDLQSRTFLPPGTVVIKFKDEQDMLNEIKKTKYKFKESDLSEESKQKFKDENLDDKVEKEPKEIAK